MTSQAPQITNPQFNGLSGGNVTYLGGGGTFTFNSTDTTSYQIVISAGADFDPANPANATLTGVASNGLNTVNWNGRNNANTDFPTGSFSYKVVGRNGEIHFPIVDTEGNKNGGPQLTRLNGLSAPDTTIFYDDRGYLTRDGNAVGQLNGKLCGASSTQTQPAPVYSLLGVDSSDTNLGGSGHAYRYWPGYGNSQSDCSNSSGFGDAKSLDLWAFQQTPVETGTVQIDPQPAQATVSTAVSVPPTANPGATVNGSFSYSNVSSVNATSVQYGATIGTPGNCPTNLAFSSLPSGASWTYNSSTCVVSLSGMPSTLIAGADLDFNFSYTAPGSGSIPVDTTISAGNDPAHPVASPATAHGETVVNSADIAVTKTVDNATPVFGATVTFTVTVTNNGPDDASNVTVNDTLPSGYTLSNATPSKGSFASGVWTVGGLANGASETLTLEVVVNASGGYLNSATAGADQYDPDNGNNTDSASTTPSASADIAVTKTVDNATPAVGSNVTFTITTTNNGPSDASGVSVADTLPSGYSYVSDNGGGAYNSGTGVWTIGNLANGASASLTITAKVLASGNYTNTATGSATETDPVPGNNSDSAGTTPSASADIAVTKTVDNATPAVGSNVTFTITTTNNGPSDATGVSVSDTLPSGYSYVSDNGGGAYNSGTGVWTIGNLANGASASLTITATVKASGNYTNTATGSATETDPVPGNNSDSASTTPTPSADLSITKTDGSATYTPGSTISYTIVAGNAGPSDVTGATVSDTVPAAITGATWTCVASTGASCTASGSGNISDTVNIPNGGNVTYTLTGTVKSDTTGNLVNTATVAAPAGTTDPDGGNNSATDTDTLDAQADLVVTKTGSASVVPGNNVVYTITVKNNGPSDAAAVSLADPAPAGLSFVSADAPCSGGFPCSLGTMASGSTVTVANVTFSVPSGYSGPDPIVNTATATSATPDPDTGNNSDSASTTLASGEADLEVVKTGPASVTAGGSISWTVVVTNHGPSDADGASFSDPVPSGVTAVSAACGAETGGAVCGSVSVASNTVSSTITTLPAGGSVSFTISGTAPMTNIQLSNTAYVAPPSDVSDPDGSDNSSSSDTNVGIAGAAIEVPVDSRWLLILLSGLLLLTGLGFRRRYSR